MSTTITCVSTEAPCPSNANDECLTVTVSKTTPRRRSSRDAGYEHHRAQHHLVHQRAADLESELLVRRFAIEIRAWRGRGHDERGATFILVAVSMVLLLWGGAFGVDLGLTVDGVVRPRPSRIRALSTWHASSTSLTG